MPRVARAMIEMAKLSAMTVDSRAWIPTPAEAWHMITRGNADALGWPDAGRLEVGAGADLLMLRPEIEFDRHLIGRLIYNWDDRFISHRIVNGRVFHLG
jgi:guanine deaminase